MIARLALRVVRFVVAAPIAAGYLTTLVVVLVVVALVAAIAGVATEAQGWPATIARQFNQPGSLEQWCLRALTGRDPQ